MDKIRNAAIILIGLGEKCAADILKDMSPEEVQAVVAAINKIESVTEVDVVKALNEFFKYANGNDGIDLVTKENVKKSIVSAVESGRVGSSSDDKTNDKNRWIEFFKWQDIETIVTIIQEEHPQIIAVIATTILNTEKAAKVLKCLPKTMQTQVIHRMTSMGPISTFAMEALCNYFATQLETTEKYNDISVDGIESVANIMSYMDNDTKQGIMDELSTTNQLLHEKIQEKILPFENLANMDSKSMQLLIKEVNNEDLVLALKGTDEYVKTAFLRNMSQKAAEIVKDEMESKGPVKIARVTEAQQRILVTAKKLQEEDKIILPGRGLTDVVY